MAKASKKIGKNPAVDHFHTLLTALPVGSGSALLTGFGADPDLHTRIS